MIEEDGEDKNGVAKGKKIFTQTPFLDSFKFILTCLDNLTNNLTQGGKTDEKLVNTKKYFPRDKMNLLMRKGIYPYDYMDSFERLSETKLPPKEAFYSRLAGCGISDEDYEHAQRVWGEFNIKNLREYTELYVKLDVMLLTDVFENFREFCMKNYDLDRAWYYTAPGLAYDALFKKTAQSLELLDDVDMMLIIERGIRGGISMISKRYAKANNLYMGDQFDNNSVTKYLVYLDANNLYGYAMVQKLPTHGFKWMTEEEMKNWRLHPCILEVDLEHPRELHDSHNEYQLAPERVKINRVEKLIPNLNDKVRYVIHHENLKFYFKMGLKQRFTVE